MTMEPREWLAAIVRDFLAGGTSLATLDAWVCGNHRVLPPKLADGVVGLLSEYDDGVLTRGELEDALRTLLDEDA